jgi:hypothetical protein
MIRINYTPPPMPLLTKPGVSGMFLARFGYRKGLFNTVFGL